MKWDERQAGAGGWADVCARVRASAGGGGSPARWRRLLVHAAWWCAVGERPPPPVCERWRRGREGEGQSKGRWRLRWRLSTGVAACVRVREGVRVRALAGALGCGGGGGAPWESAVAWGRAVGSGSRRGGHVGGGARTVHHASPPPAAPTCPPAPRAAPSACAARVTYARQPSTRAAAGTRSTRAPGGAAGCARGGATRRGAGGDRAREGRRGCSERVVDLLPAALQVPRLRHARVVGDEAGDGLLHGQIRTLARRAPASDLGARAMKRGQGDERLRRQSGRTRSHRAREERFRALTHRVCRRGVQKWCLRRRRTGWCPRACRHTSGA